MADCTKCANRNNEYCLYGCYNGESFKFITNPTNADRIRSMTDEELADCLSKNRGGCRALTTESYVCDFYTDDLNTDCKACWLDWLQKEVEE